MLNVNIVKLLTRRITALPGLQQYHSVAACCWVPYQAILTASCSTDQWFASTWSKQSELRAVAFAAPGKWTAGASKRSVKWAVRLNILRFPKVLFQDFLSEFKLPDRLSVGICVSAWLVKNILKNKSSLAGAKVNSDTKKLWTSLRHIIPGIV